MTTMLYTGFYRFFFLVLIISTNFFAANAQNRIGCLWEGKAKLSKKINNKWSAHGTFLIEQNSGLGDYDFTMVQKMESGFNANRKLLNRSKIGGGLVYVGYNLFRPEVKNEYRMMEQYSFSFSLLKYNIDNRIRTEQRIHDDKYRNRWRYRLSIDFPLVSPELNPKAPYVVVSDELLYNFNAWNQDLENRLTLGFGWHTASGTKTQLALQYRLSKIGLANQSQTIYLVTLFNFSL